MPRAKKITSEDLCRLALDYQQIVAGMKITIPAFGEYVRSQGYAVEDYLIRRNKEVREHIEAYNQAIVQRNIDAVIVFHGLDIDAFLAKNSSPQALKEALTKRDAYYEKIANNASELKKKNEKLEQENNQLKKELEKAQQDLAVKRNHDRDAEIQTKNELIRKLREIIYSRVYPEMANLILQKEGIFESVNKLIMPEAIDAHMMTADQKIKTFRCTALNVLLSDFDE